MRDELVFSQSHIPICDKLPRATEASQDLVLMERHLVESLWGRYPHSHRLYPTGAQHSADSVSARRGPSKSESSAIAESRVEEVKVLKAVHMGYLRDEDYGNIRRIDI